VSMDDAEDGREANLTDEFDRRLDAAVARIAATSPDVAPDRLTHHREMLMIQVMQASSHESSPSQAPGPTPATRGARRTLRRRLAMTGLAIAAGATLVTGPAAAAHLQQWLHRAPATVEEADMMEVIYQGRSYTPGQIHDLQERTGKPVVVVEDPISYDKGRAHAFDTAQEADQWACRNLPQLAHRPVCTGAATSSS